ncbi:hypothetical protein [Arthrobacter crystallopoietes]|uniref:Uncharacterized protein n=1 Tax=Crystallibacter crystallopoietes TaxID=37928 RepID=A0A1H0ZRX2_9MICC|nr:hypothetical protein [Arthrobacter crystallopoietes]AUI51843.1 hypothetical protein AC20117_14655 [Arthrobacter crystallopoietes]SDQ30167.1 hypothetical protein SAMN04489742_0528 [Arthrobacter crystallopoietes]
MVTVSITKSVRRHLSAGSVVRISDAVAITLSICVGLFLVPASGVGAEASSDWAAFVLGFAWFCALVLTYRSDILFPRRVMAECWSAVKATFWAYAFFAAWVLLVEIDVALGLFLIALPLGGAFLMTARYLLLREKSRNLDWVDRALAQANIKAPSDSV